jgi:hypothetical protein
MALRRAAHLPRSTAEHMKPFAFILATVGLIALASGIADGQARCTFPGKSQRCSSPRDLWEVEWREPSGNGGHTLWLKATGSATPTKLLEFERSADLLWSPDGRSLAVTDHAGSSESVLWVFTGPTLLPAVNVEGRLRASLGELPEIFRNGHRYLEALGWVRGNLLRFRVRAYDSEPGKEYKDTFRYDLSGHVRRERSK